MRTLRLFRNHGLAVLAMLLLLLGTAAPALARMTCVMGGHTELSVGQPEDCCPTDHAHPTDELKATCCEVLQAQPQRDDFVAGTHVAVPVPTAVPMAWPVQVPLPLVHAVQADGSGVGPPPAPLLRVLASTGVFRI